MTLGMRMARAELAWSSLLVALVAAGLVLAAAVVAGLFAGSGGCDADRIGPQCAGLAQSMRPWEQAGQLLVGSLYLLPFALGALLGVAVTAGELDHRTAHLAWTLDGSRVRWFVLRAVPVALALAVLLGGVAVAAEAWTRARLVTDQPGFVDYALRSALVPLHGLLAYAIGLVAGTAFGRTLPALLVAIGFTLAVNAGLLAIVDMWHTSRAAFVPLDALDRLAYPMIANHGVVVTGSDGTTGVMQIPVLQFGTWIALESAVWAAATLMAVVVALRVVMRRSPRG